MTEVSIAVVLAIAIALPAPAFAQPEPSVARDPFPRTVESAPLAPVRAADVKIDKPEPERPAVHADSGS